MIPAHLLVLALALAGTRLGGLDPQARVVPLFADDAPLEITLAVDLPSLKSDRRGTPEEHAAALTVHGLQGGVDTLDVQLRPRGDFRLDPVNCSFPPLRLNVKSRQAQGTVFEGQDKLKLVVPCRPGSDAYEGYVLREYLLYRVYRLLTETSFRVRLVRATFRDTTGEDDSFTCFAFLIEDEDGLAARLGGRVMDIPEGKIVRAGVLDPEASTRVAVFQYMIGNTDWADARVHNVKILAVGGRVIPVPYDFDFAGAVEAPYASPPPELPIVTVRQRHYMGWCRPGMDLEPILQRFRAARPSVEELYRTFPYLDERIRNATIAYFARFYDYIETPERARRRFLRDCRDLPR